MNIYLSGSSPLNSIYAHESGQVLYKVVTPLAFGSRTSTIHKVLPNLPEEDRVCLDKFDILEDEDDEKTLTNEALKDKFMEWATISHKLIGSSVMRFDGQAIETLSYFRTEGFGPCGHHRVFTGPDGREYKWFLGFCTSRLCLHDEAQTPVALFHQRSLGIIGKKHPAYLEIFPAGLKIIDTILVTFLYIEKKRKARERAQKYHAAAG